MEIAQFINYMDRQQASQAILPPDEPPRLLVGEKWKSANTSPSSTAIEIMLRGAMPPVMRPKLDEVNGQLEFDCAVNGNAFRIRCESKRGARTVVITRLGSNGQLLAPRPETNVISTPDELQVSVLDGASSRPGAIPNSITPPPLNLSPTKREMGQPPLSFNPMPSAPVVTGTSSSPPPLPTVTQPKAPPVDEKLAALREQLNTIEWYHAAGGAQIGPIKMEVMEALIKSKVIKGETMVWHKAMPDWAMAKLTELESFLPIAPPELPGDVLSGHGVYGSLNSSGTGSNSAIPREAKVGFNGGAFFLTPFWLCAHNLWPWGLTYFVANFILGLLLPGLSWLISIGLSIYVGSIGDEIAWQNREFKDVEEFRSVQKLWAYWGVGAFGFFAIVGTLAITSSAGPSLAP